MARVLLELNNPVFQESWLSLEREAALVVLAALKKLRRLEWDQLYRDSGWRWEAIVSRTGPAGKPLHSLRLTRRVRAVACRDGDFLRLLALHADHDSAPE